MGVLDFIFKKPIPILKEEDITELNEIKRKAYMDEARKIMESRGKLMANQELGIKKSNGGF